MEEIGELIQKICKHASISEEEAKKQISEKMDELSGLVSEEGAAYIVAKELGLSMIRMGKRQLKIKNLVSGLRSVDLLGRIVQVSDVRDFQRAGKAGKVANITLGDDTGLVRLSLWNEEIGLIESAGLREGDTIRLSGGYVKMDNRGNPELRIGRGVVERTEEKIEIPKLSEMKETGFGVASRNVIAGFREGGYEEVRAAIVQIFKRNPFYEVCPECGGRVSQNEAGKWACKEHGQVKPEFSIVLSGVIDDDTGNVRIVMFRELAEKLFGKTAKELREIMISEKNPLDIFKYFEGLGKEYVIRGRVKKNDLTESLEFVANDVEEIDVKAECEKLIGKLENQA
jgi:ssDNA-binding replication factor A large subunit